MKNDFPTKKNKLITKKNEMISIPCLRTICFNIQVSSADLNEISAVINSLQ